MTKTSRLHELIARIHEKPKFTVDELAEEFQVSYRTMLRYLQELSGMGVPLYSETGKHGGYSLLRRDRAHIQVGDSFKRVIRPATHVVGLEFNAPFTAVYMAKVRIPAMWEHLNNRQHEISKATVKSRRIGVSLRRSQFYHYIAGIEVPSPVSLLADMVSITLPPREYAVYTHVGETSRAEIDETYFFLLDKLRKIGLDHDPEAHTLEEFKGKHPYGLTVSIPLK